MRNEGKSIMNNLTIKTATVSINVLQVDGRKMTKATFYQFKFMQDGNSAYYNPDVNSVLGYVRDSCLYLVFVENGDICRCYPYGDYIERHGIQQLYIAT